MSKNEEFHYTPLMCGCCKSWLDCDKRTDYGREGYCPITHQKTYGIDWCHVKEEQILHKKAMECYVSQSEKEKLRNADIRHRRSLERKIEHRRGKYARIFLALEESR